MSQSKNLWQLLKKTTPNPGSGTKPNLQDKWKEWQKSKDRKDWRTTIGKLIVNMSVSFRNNLYNRTEEPKELLLKESIQIAQDSEDCYPVHPSTGLANTTKHSYFENEVLMKNIFEMRQSFPSKVSCNPAALSERLEKSKLFTENLLFNLKMGQEDVL